VNLARGRCAGSWLVGYGVAGDMAQPERPNQDLEVLTWPMFGVAIRELAEEIVRSGFRPDLVLTIARGGLTVGGAMAYALGTKNCATINVEYYTGVDQRLDLPVVLPPVPDPVGLDDLNVLIADDVADTGGTLGMVTEFCRQHVREARTCVLYRKPWSTTDPDFVWRETDRWIAFPWSVEEPVTGIDEG
ncbi:MAG TPA: phosphoribosyltransferase family protein, partial [Acidimicrobiales bacterium]|nr:phosphoribosyltransferase family protein [Acidimicrobiales bacterium]